MAEAVAADRELQALVSLLNTEEPHSVSLLTEQMRAFPRSRLHHLADLAQPASTALAQIELVLAESEAIRTEAEIRRWRQTGQDLETGMDLVVRMRFPRTPLGALGHALDRLADDIERKLPTADSAKRLKAFVYCFHQVLGFRGNDAEYYDPDNTYLNRVIERRLGIPLSLTVLYHLVGKRLGLDIGVVGLPSHVVASMPGVPSAVYVDPYHLGRSLTLADITQIVRNAGYVFHPEQLRRASTVQIMQRTLANLEGAYERRHESDRASLIQQFRLAL